MMHGTFAAVDEFMTAAALGIGERERAALIKVLGMLEAGELQHVPPIDNALWVRRSVPFTKHFNMAHWRTIGPCGTVACIGGTAELLGADFGAETAGELRELFFPRSGSMGRITPAQAAVALRSYLTFGKPRWRAALKGSGMRARDRNLVAQLSECQATE